MNKNDALQKAQELLSWVPEVSDPINGLLRSTTAKTIYWVFDERKGYDNAKRLEDAFRLKVNALITKD